MTNAKLLEQLRQLQEAQGPFVSLYLSTEGARELASEEMDLRWRGFRDEIRGRVPDKALLLLDDVVEDAHRKRDGLVALTSGEEVAFRRFLTAPIADEVSAGPLPHLVPLLEWVQDHPSYGIVLVDRAGGDIHVVGGLREDLTIEIKGDHDELRKVNPGGWSQRRFQNRAEDSWEQNAAEVAGALDRIVEAEGLELILLMGDVRSVSYLEEHVGPNIRPLLHHLDTAPPTADRLDEIRDEVEAEVAALTGGTVRQTLERFAEERGQRDLAVEGDEATLSALRMAQVDTLLISRDRLGATAWFSRGDVTQGATSRGPLEEIGLGDLEEAPTEDVMVRLALGTGAAVSVIPSLPVDHGPRDGIGALLRYATDSTPAS